MSPWAGFWLGAALVILGTCTKTSDEVSLAQALANYYQSKATGQPIGMGPAKLAPIAGALE